mgnify:CR=1 FL=1
MKNPEPMQNDDVPKPKPHRVWTRTTIPRGWDRAFAPDDDDEGISVGSQTLTLGSSHGSQGGFDPPERSSNVEIEVDGIVMQSLIAQLSKTPGRVRWAGRSLGADNEMTPGPDAFWFED